MFSSLSGKIIFSLPMLSVFIMSGCGGGGGSPSPTQPTVLSSPSVIISRACDQYSNINSEKYMTDEYCRNENLAKLGVSTAYSNGYTGQGVTIAIIDSGVDMKNYDIAANSLTLDAISYVGINYNTTTSSLENTVNGVTSDQIERIVLSNSGSGYSVAPTITVSGDGTGASAIALLDANGSVSGIYMTQRGSGYTSATFSIDDTGTNGSGASIDTFYFGGYDDLGHGTSVAGVSSGVKQQTDVNSTYDGYSIQGVAYNSKILNVKVLDNTGYGQTWQIEKGIDYAVSKGAQVLNISIGTLSQSSFSGSKTTFTNALTANSTVVVAAGNDGKACLEVGGSIDGQCSFPAALPFLAGNGDLLTNNGGWVIVGSVSSDNTISYFSNRAGVTKGNYLVAYGEGVLSPSLNDSQVSSTGTSFATPFVAGAMALMIEKYPFLNGRDAAQIFFDTATDLGAVGIDEIYGNGLINVYAAFAPIGSLSVVSSSDGTVGASGTSVESTSLSLSGAVGSGLISSQALKNVVAFDDYDRGFSVDLTQSIGVNNGNSFDFDKFFIMNYGDFLLGMNQQEKQFAVGYKIAKSVKIMLSYDDTLLGSTGEGSLGFGNANTFYGSLISQTKSAGIEFSGQIDYGYAQAEASGDSLISSISDIQALGGAIKAQYKGIGLKYKVPLTSVVGNMMLSVPTSRNLDGTINYNNSLETMTNGNYEQDYSLFYEMNGKSYKTYLSYSLIQNLGGLYSDSLYQDISVNFSYYF